MTKFTIETTYRVPVYRHKTYEAESVEEACRMAIEDHDWEHQKEDYDCLGPEYITGAWEGEDAAYAGAALPIPPEHANLGDTAAAVDFVHQMARFTTPENEWAAQRSDEEAVAADMGTHVMGYADVDELIADMDDERLRSEYATFMDMVRRAREIAGAANPLRDAAPDMLAALKSLDRMNRGVDWCDQGEQARRWASARAAIAKAEGR